MKKLIFLLIVLGVSAGIGLHSCTKEVAETPGMNFVSITSNGVNFVDEYDTVRDVDPSVNIVAKFSNPVDFATVRDSTILLYRDTTRLRLNFIIEGNTITLDPVLDILSGANLTLEFTSGVKSVGGSALADRKFNLKTTGIGVDTPPRAGSQLLYVQFNNSVSDATGHAVLRSSKLSYTVDRYGVANGAGYFRGPVNGQGSTGDIVEFKVILPVLQEADGDSLIAPAMSVSMWLNISKATYKSILDASTIAVFGLAAEKGYYFDIGIDTADGPKSVTFETNHKLGSGGYYQSADNFQKTLNGDSVGALLKDGWHQVVLTYDPVNTVKTFYFDGLQKFQTTLSDKAPSIDGIALNASDTSALAIGYYSAKDYIGSTQRYETATNTFRGALDDFRIFKVVLSPAEVEKLYRMEDLGSE